MKHLFPCEIDIPIYCFRLNNFLGKSSYKVMFRIHYTWRHGVCPFHCSSPQWDLLSDLSRNPNGDRMQKLCPMEVDIATYHIEVPKIIGVLSSRVMFRVHDSWSDHVVPFNYFSSLQDLYSSLLIFQNGYHNTFHYCGPQRELYNDPSSDQKGDRIHKLCP